MFLKFIPTFKIKTKMMSRRHLLGSGFLNNTFMIFILVTMPLHNSIRAQIIINEIMAYNATGIINPEMKARTDWIEIHNAGAATLDISNYSLSDERDNPDKWNFPAGTVLDPDEYLLIWADNEEDLQPGLHAGFKLSVAGETVFLTDQNNLLLDSLLFSRQFEDVSFGRNDTGGLVYFPSPTPGWANDPTSSYRMASGIHYDPKPGVYPDPVLLKLSWDEPDAIIRYTLDGSDPDENSDIFPGEMDILTNTVIRTKIFSDGYLPGWIETATYLIGDTFKLPVFSLVTDPANLWDDQIGIYVVGTNGIPGYCVEEPRNWNQEWERPVSLEYFAGSGPRTLFTDGGLKIHGGCSRQFNLKSLGFLSRNEYGNNELRYPFFREKNVDWFKDLIFRNSGNDFPYTFMRDGVSQSLGKGMGVDGQAFEPAQIFLNGEYWGILNLREDLNEHYFTSNYGIPGEEIDLLKWYNYAISGTADAYWNLEYFIGSHDLSLPENYEYVESKIDIDEYINFLIIEMFIANRDWPGNNQKYWRRNTTDGKWRWAMFDMDFAWGLYEFNPGMDMFTFTAEPNGPDWPNPPWSTFLFRSLLTNQEFRDKFILQFMMHLNTTFQPDNVIHVIDSFQARIYDVFPTQVARWGEPWSMMQWNNNVEELRNFARMRPDFVWDHMRNFFSLGEEIYLEVKDPDSAGMVNVNDFTVPHGGMTGKYFSGRPLNLEAFPSQGYRFVRWDISPGGKVIHKIIARQSPWKYSDTGIYPGSGWNTGGYNDSSWPEGYAELGYGDGDENTQLSWGTDPANKPLSYYFRRVVEVDNLEQYDEQLIQLKCDDGAVIFINGKEILRVNMPDGVITHTTQANNSPVDENAFYEYVMDDLNLRNGPNIIAVEIHQGNPASSDISFDMEIITSYFRSGVAVPREGSPLTLTPAAGLIIQPVFESTEEIPSIIINEFMATNQDAYEDEYGEDADWIELFNTEQYDVNIAGFYITDDLDDPFKWQIPEGFPEQTTIPAGGYLVLFADRDTLQGPLHADIKLGAGGEEIGLSLITNNTFHWLDTLSYGPQFTNLSYGRYPDAAANWEIMYLFTPGASNLFTTVPAVNEPEFMVYVYPNPADEFAYLEITGLPETTSGNYELSLLDVTGRTIRTDEIWIAGSGYTGTIDLTGIPQGFYILRFGSGMKQKSIQLIRK